jgi:hypothetical protein
MIGAIGVVAITTARAIAVSGESGRELVLCPVQRLDGFPRMHSVSSRANRCKW